MVLDLGEMLPGRDGHAGYRGDLIDDLVADRRRGPPPAHERGVDDQVRAEARSELRDQRALEAPSEDAEEEHRPEAEPEGRDRQRRPPGLVAHLRGGESAYRTEEPAEHQPEQPAPVNHQRR